jgi:hypothetical protein
MSATGGQRAQQQGQGKSLDRSQQFLFLVFVSFRAEK